MVREKGIGDSIGALALRLGIGTILFVHGSQKVLGIFGGSGMQVTIEVFETRLGIPPVFAVLAMTAEFAGGLGILFGFLTRIAAFGGLVNFLVAMIKVHLKNGFFLHMRDPEIGAGIEYTLALSAACAFLLFAGAGRFSLDGAIYARKRIPFFA